MKLAKQIPNSARPWALAFLGLGITITTGIWVNLLSTTAAVTDSPWTISARELGLNNLWLVGAVLLAGSEITLTIMWRRSDRRGRQATMSVFERNQEELLKGILATTVKGIRALRPDVRLNARYFVHATEHGQDILRKAYRIHVETDPMPDEYGLDKAFIHEDNLVICSAFINRAPVYDELESDHMKRYGARIRHAIDPKQRWVLACPVFRKPQNDEQPNGVIVFFGTKPLVSAPGEVNLLKQAIVSAADAFRLALYAKIIVEDGYD